MSRKPLSLYLKQVCTSCDGGGWGLGSVTEPRPTDYQSCITHYYFCCCGYTSGTQPIICIDFLFATLLLTFALLWNCSTPRSTQAISVLLWPFFSYRAWVVARHAMNDSIQIVLFIIVWLATPVNIESMWVTDRRCFGMMKDYVVCECDISFLPSNRY